MGVFFGLVLFLLKTAFSPVLSNFQWLDHKSVSAWMLMAFGVFSFNLPNYMRRRAELPPDIEIQIEKIRRMKEAGHLSRENEARLWLLLVGAQTQAATSVAETQG